MDQLHYQHCPQYQKIIDSGALTPLYLPVRLFKQYELCSVPKASVVKTLTSSGTTSQTLSKIFLDKETSVFQTKVLVNIMQNYLGKDRLPMLIIDHPGVIKDRSSFSARGAGILGLSTFGRQHTYALNEDMTINLDLVADFLAKNKGKTIFRKGDDLIKDLSLSKRELAPKIV